MRVRCEIAALAVIAGCGRIGFEAVEDAPLGPFGPPQRLDTLSSASFDGDPSLREDRLEIYFSSERPGGLGGRDIWRATRASATTEWEPPQPETALSTASNDSNPSLSHDGLVIFISSGDPYDIYVAARATVDDPWMAPVPEVELDSSTQDYASGTDLSGTRMIFASERTGFSDLYATQRAVVAADWDAPTMITELDTSATEHGPHLSPDALTVYFTSNRFGTEDFYVAMRPSLVEVFGSVVLLGEISTSSANEDDLWVTSDQRVYLYSSDATGNNDLYEVTR